MPATRSFHCPRWAELPSIMLYMDQVVALLDETLKPLCIQGEPVVTKTMVNNYVKQKLMNPPERKKYSREHMAVLIVVSVLKRALSMPEIAGLLAALAAEYGLETAYDLFCKELERAVVSACSDNLTWADPQGDRADALLSAALMAWTGKLLVQEHLSMPTKIV